MAIAKDNNGVSLDVAAAQFAHNRTKGVDKQIGIGFMGNIK